MAENAITIDPVTFRQDVPSIGTWHEWLKQAQAATTLEQKVGLLHAGFDVRMDGAPYGVTYTPLDCLQFYFGVADGWTNPYSFRDAGMDTVEEPKHHCGYHDNGYPIERSQSEQRALLATKAFNMLVARFFRPWLNEHDRYEKRTRERRDYYKQFLKSGLLQIIQQFFRYGEGQWTNSWEIHNLNYESHWTPQEKIVVKFLLLMPDALWSWEPTEIQDHWTGGDRRRLEEQNRVVQDAVVSGKVWIVQILSFLGRLDLLDPYPIGTDEPCMQALEVIALQNKLSSHSGLVLEDRTAVSVEEACALGCPTARYVLYRRTQTTERQRLIGIRDAEREQRDTRRVEQAAERERTQLQQTVAQAQARLSQLEQSANT